MEKGSHIETLVCILLNSFLIHQNDSSVCFPICTAQNIFEKQQCEWQLLVKSVSPVAISSKCTHRDKKKMEKLSSYLTYVCILLQHVQFVDNSEVKSFVLNQNNVCVCPHLYGAEYFR